MTEYDYTKTPVSVDRLTVEIQASAIVTALDHITTFGAALSIFFKADLADGDKTILDGLVTAHGGLPLPENVTQTVNIGTQPAVAVAAIPPLANNNAGGGKAYYQRCVGIQQAVAATTTTTFTWTQSVFPLAQVYEVEVIGGETGDYVDFKVLDKHVSPLYGTPDAVLNQFGFAVNVAKDYYTREGKFPATVPQNLQFQMSYYSMSAKTIGVNFILHEVK